MVALSGGAGGQRGHDGTVRLWSADGSGEPLNPARPRGLGCWLRRSARTGRGWSPRGRDGTVRLWRADGSGEPVILRGHEGGVMAASFSPDGTRWSAPAMTARCGCGRRRQRRAPDPARPRGCGLLRRRSARTGRGCHRARSDGTVRVWQADGSGEPVVLRGHEGMRSGRLRSARTGRGWSARADDGTVRVWQADGSGEPWSCAATGLGQVGLVQPGRDAGGQRRRGRHGAGVAGRRQRRARGPARPRGRGVLGRRSARTGRGWSARARTARCGCGTADGSGEPLILRGHEGGHVGRRSARTGRGWSARAKTARCGCGRPMAAASR